MPAVLGRQAFSYDFHIHSCLSPCGEDDMTPANIIGMAKLKKLDVIALTDHNSARNCPAALALGRQQGLLVIPGMELTTVEEVHVLCLFASLKDAMAFDSFVYDRLQKIQNKEEIFGHQWVMDERENIIANEPFLLINATNIAFSQAADLMESYHGVMIPAHIDKNSNSLLYNLGFVPPDSRFLCAEVKDLSKRDELLMRHPYLQKCNLISDSDAHMLWAINEPVHFIQADQLSREAVLKALITPQDSRIL